MLPAAVVDCGQKPLELAPADTDWDVSLIGRGNGSLLGTTIPETLFVDTDLGTGDIRDSQC